MTEAGLSYWNQLLDYNTKHCEENVTIQRLIDIKNSNSVTYTNAEDFAKAISANWSESLQKFLGPSSHIPNGVTPEDIEEMVKMAMGKSYKFVAHYSADVELIALSDAKVGIKPITTSISRDRINNLIEKIRETSEGNALLINDDNAWLLEPYVQESVARSAVIDTIIENAQFQTKAGLITTIERDTGSGCCDWCNKMAGVYEYGDEPKDFYRVHSACTCTFKKRVGKTLDSVMSSGRGKGTRKLITF